MKLNLILRIVVLSHLATRVFGNGSRFNREFAPWATVADDHGTDRRRPQDLLMRIRGGAIARIRRKAPVVAKTVTVKNDLPVGTASVPSEIFNLIKTIVGAGVLGIPAGIAAFGSAPSALIPALILTAIIGTLSASSFSMIGLVCGRTSSRSYRSAWEASVGVKTSWMPAAASLLVTFCSVLAYSMILKSTLPDVAQALFGMRLSQTAALIGVTVSTLLPLCLAKSLSALAPFSLIGILGMVYTVTMMMFRWSQGSYADGGRFAGQVTPPQFGNAGWESVFSGNSAILVSMLATAFMAHYNAPKLYWELSNNTIDRWNVVVASGYAGAFLLKAFTATAGFLTFGAGAKSLILNNYAVQDTFMSVSRIAVTLSLLCSYPLAFVGVREGIFDLTRTSTKRREQVSNFMTVGMLSLITVLAFFVKDIKLLMAFGGATWGNWLTYVFPAVMLCHLAYKQPPNGAADTYADLRSKVPRAVLTGGIGICLSIIGTIRAVQSA